MLSCERPHGLYSPWNFPGQNTGVGSHSPSPGDLPNPGIEPKSPVLGANSLPTEPPRKPSKNTGVGSLSLLQQIFPTQEWNRGLLHCRRIHCQLSHQEASSGLRQGGTNCHVPCHCVRFQVAFPLGCVFSSGYKCHSVKLELFKPF